MARIGTSPVEVGRCPLRSKSGDTHCDRELERGRKRKRKKKKKRKRKRKNRKRRRSTLS